MAQQMFGSFDPELIKQAIAAEEERNLLSQAQLGPAQMQNLIQLRAGQNISKNLGQIVGGIFGVEAQDPRLRQAQMAQEAYQEALQATGGDANSPAFFKALSNSAAAKGLTSLAQQSAIQASTLASEMAQEFQRRGAGIASIAQASREREPGKVGVTADTGEIVYQQGGQQFVIRNGQRVPFQGSVRQEGGTNVKVEVKGQENVLDIDKEDAKGYRAARESATKALPTLNKMQAILDQGIITGTAADARVGFLKALDTLGVSTAEARKVVGNNEQFNIQVRNLLQSIIKQFGYNPSNADVRFALESLPNASNSPEGLRAILSSLVKANKDQLNESTRALDYYRKNKGSFEGFQPNLDLVSPGGMVKTPSQMTTEELRAAIAAQKAQQGK